MGCETYKNIFTSLEYVNIQTFRKMMRGFFISFENVELKKRLGIKLGTIHPVILPPGKIKV